jgi:hypothetical protein
MGRPKEWAAAKAGRPPMQSPGRPPVARREDRQWFWAAIRRGLSSEDAAVAAGVSQPVRTRWFREAGGMPPITRAPLSGRYLSFAEREEIAILHARSCGVREIARRTARSPSTIFRELRSPCGKDFYRLPGTAVTCAWPIAIACLRGSVPYGRPSACSVATDGAEMPAMADARWRSVDYESSPPVTDVRTSDLGRPGLTRS